jgi:hypothetical protein
MSSSSWRAREVDAQGARMTLPGVPLPNGFVLVACPHAAEDDRALERARAFRGSQTSRSVAAMRCAGRRCRSPRAHPGPRMLRAVQQGSTMPSTPGALAPRELSGNELEGPPERAFA